jgi:hypothetical protein
MPKNPSERQREASKRNLKGHYGPKTEEGKLKSSRNGLQNIGDTRAKQRARQIAGRWGPKTETFYSYANCLGCVKNCLWPSFSVETPLDGSMPLGCLKEVLEERPSRCFYYFEGFCCGSYATVKGASLPAACVLDDEFAEVTAQRLGKLAKDAVQVELKERKRIWRLKKEMASYLEVLRQQGPKEAVWTPRMIYVSREFQSILRGCRLCRLEPWRSSADLDETLELLFQGELITTRQG